MPTPYKPEPAFAGIDEHGNLIITQPADGLRDERTGGASFLVALLLSALSGCFVGAVGALLLRSV